tara:strand:- start:366 stop:701 length:336 start_codon:yes stop_codon:yes gene_type:complete
MNAFWNKKKEEPTSDAGGSLTWNSQATAAIEQSLAQAPVPKLMKNQIKKQLMNAAEATTRAAGRTEVTAEDVMQGLLASMPEDVRSQVEDAVQTKDPKKLQDLQNKLRRQK